MSTKRIDHVGAATQTIAAIGEIGYANDDGYRKQEYLAEAQVHATLALVEQQRIANLIAAGEAFESRGIGMRNGLRRDIAAALGIDS